MALRIKSDVDLKELEKYGFKEYNDCWQRDYNNGYCTNIYKDTKEIIKVDYEWSFLKNKYYKKRGLLKRTSEKNKTLTKLYLKLHRNK